ncbi:hypothetical protein Mgra_00009640 [Meloidogyne graminicola]|uniref:Uncharacterized protein n=1 Tax=Meloidogyne graminicola TaxID=189291 RepID=A0A8S9Z9I7_9BILA|nr:hypothetical protein Mgra_00009640 [Meloidogyne graminicola]
MNIFLKLKKVHLYINLLVYGHLDWIYYL